MGFKARQRRRRNRQRKAKKKISLYIQPDKKPKNIILNDVEINGKMDGHCWVERDGKIIDPHFQRYYEVADIRDVPHKKFYCKAPEEIQALYHTYFKNKYGWILDLEDCPFDKPLFGCCAQNALLEIKLNGGKFIFGSMGVGDIKNIWWEYGGKDYWSISDFQEGKHRVDECIVM
tara:strand:- start:768 stop:1292 length:525 start_codon:yes stop_codon:yes gene_type:complete